MSVAGAMLDVLSMFRYTVGVHYIGVRRTYLGCTITVCITLVFKSYTLLRLTGFPLQRNGHGEKLNLYIDLILNRQKCPLH